MTKILESLFLTLAIYGLLGWLYVVLNSAVHPQSLAWPLTHFFSFPREDTAGIVSFVVSMTSFFFWRLIRTQAIPRTSHETRP